MTFAFDGCRIGYFGALSLTNMRQVFYIFNYLYKHHYWVYKPLYFIYKQLTDYTKIKRMKRIILPGSVVLDIGANIGYYSLQFAKMVGKEGKVYAYEPDARNFSLLKNNISEYEAQIDAFEVAVGEHQGTLKLYHSDGLNVDHQTYDSGEGRRWTEIQVVRLDDALPKTLLVNFIKIDIQGFDFYAIKGMNELITRSEKLIILGELWPYGLKKSGTSVWDYLAHLEFLGFDIYFFEPLDETKLTLMEGQLEHYSDYLAFRSAFFSKNWIQKTTENLQLWSTQKHYEAR